MEEDVLKIKRTPVKYSVFAEKYPTEESCRESFEKMFWRNTYPICPFCRGYRIYRYKNNRDYKCGFCKKKFRLSIGSISKNSNLPLQKWLYFFYLYNVYKEVPDTKALMSKMEISKPTAIRIRKKSLAVLEKQKNS